MNNIDLTNLSHKELTDAFIEASDNGEMLTPYVTEFRRRSMLSEMAERDYE